MKFGLLRPVIVTLFASALFLPGAASSKEIEVSGWGGYATAFPYAIMLENGYLEEIGIDGVRAGDGGGATVRALLNGDLPYAEAGVAAVIAANREGADLKIISQNQKNTADSVWIALADSPISSLKDLKGQRINYSRAGSATHAMSMLMLNEMGYVDGDVQLLATGGITQGLTALDNGGIDVALVSITHYFLSPPGKYKVVAWCDEIIPPFATTVGVTTSQAMAENPELIRGIIQARVKAIDFMKENRAEAAEIIAKYYNVAAEPMKRALDQLFDNGILDGHEYLGYGDIHLDHLKNVVTTMQLVGALEGDIDWDSMIDRSFLPENLQSQQ